MKNYGDLGGCYPPRPRAPTDNALLDLHNSSKDTQPDSLIVNYFIGPLGSLKINQQLIQWISSSKLLVVTIDNKLTWTKHISELKRGFVNKLILIKSSLFLPRNSLLDLYFKINLPSVTYALPIWGSCTNKNEFNSLESIHCKAVRVIYSLPRDMPSVDVRKTANYKITKTERALWLAERSVCMRVFKHGCDVNMFCFSRANHARTNLKTFLSLLYLPIPSSAETWKIFKNKLCQFIFA